MSEWKYPIGTEINLIYKGGTKEAIVVAHLKANSNWKSFKDLRLATKSNEEVAIEWLRSSQPSISEEGISKCLEGVNLRPLKIDRYLVWVGGTFRCPKKSTVEAG